MISSHTSAAVTVDPATLKVLMDAARNWFAELDQYIIPSAAESSADDRDRYLYELHALDEALQAVAVLIESSTSATITKAVPARCVTLVYLDSERRRHTQPLSDVVYTGTLIDPDSGDDLEIAGAEIELPEDPRGDGDDAAARDPAGGVPDDDDGEAARTAE